MAEDRWTGHRNPVWERGRRPDSRGDHGRPDDSDDRGYRPFGDDGPIYTANGGYGPRGERDLDGPRDRGDPSRRDFEADQRRRHGGDYDPDRYTPNPREGRGEEGRSWWNRTQDGLSAWFGDDQAKRRHEWDERQAEPHGEHRGRGPKGYRRSDERMHDDINDRLTEDSHLNASGIEVAVADGEVTLSGTVFRREDKRRAEDVAESVSGVSHVQNNLRLYREDGGAP